MPGDVSLHIVSGEDVCTGGGSGACVLLSTEKAQYLFNVPDTAFRLVLEKKQWKVGKLRGILFTEVNACSSSGLSDMAMALADLDMNIAAVAAAAGAGARLEEDTERVVRNATESTERADSGEGAGVGLSACADPALLLAGPSPLFGLLLSLNLVFYRPTYHVRLEELHGGCEARQRLYPFEEWQRPCMEGHWTHAGACLPPIEIEDGVLIRPIILQESLVGSEAGGSNTTADGYLTAPEYLSPAYNIAYKHSAAKKQLPSDVVCYAIHTPEIRGVFDVKAAKALGVPTGPLFSQLVAGKSVTTPSGSVVTPDMCVGPASPGPVLLILRCPSPAWIPVLEENDCLQELIDQQHRPGAARVSTIVHMVEKDVAEDAAYVQLVTRFNLAGNASMPGASGAQDTQQQGHRASDEQTGGKKAKRKAKKRGKGKEVVTEVTAVSHIFVDGSFTESFSSSGVVPLQQSAAMLTTLEALVPELAAAPAELSAYDRATYEAELATVTQTMGVLYETSVSIGETEQAYTIVPLARAGLALADVKEVQKQASMLRANLAAVRTPSSQAKPWTADAADVTPSVTFLGTAASAPTKVRGVSSILVEVPEFGNMLLDCGGGSVNQLQRQFGSAGARRILDDLKCVWVTHKHGDHCLGIIRLLVEVSRESKGHRPCASDPGGLGCHTCGHGFDFESSKQADGLVHAMVAGHDVGFPQVSHCSGSLQPPAPEDGSQPLVVIGPMWLAMWLRQHSQWIEGLHFRFVHAQDLTLGAGSAGCESAGAHPLADFFLEQMGLVHVQAVVMEHSYPTFGVVLEHICGWKLVYSADSRPCRHLVAAGRKATMLIHEATFDAPFQAKAVADRHCTVQEAVQVARDMEAEFVVLTHFSNRFESGTFPNVWMPEFLDLCGMNGRILVAADLMRLPIDSEQLRLIGSQVQPRLQALVSKSDD